MSSDQSTTIDVGSWFTTLVRNWWVIVGLIVIGVVVGAVVTKAQPEQYTATASVYIGQTTDANGNAMAGLNSNAKAATQLLAAEVVLKEAAEKTGMGISTSLLRKETSVETPSSTVKTTTSVVNIVVISVTDTKKARATAAANALAQVLLEHLDTGANEKIALLEAQLAQGQKQYAAATARATAAQSAILAIAKGGGTTAEKAAASAPYVAVAQAAADEQTALAASNQKTQLLLLTAKQVEQPRMLHAAGIPDSPSGPSMSINVAIGALAGLVIGIIVAFARRGLAERRAAKGTPAAAA
ncbi:MAG TPA: Wzz/FepE/Etk N-terminal domain-containing protein [Thermoleophilia bacterium]|nr:Wzz/FepE/Etk N-terminal domain-containing protein [Thermoleophilia bacterium]